MSEKTIKVLGVDPGYDRLGVAIIKKGDNKKLMYSDCLGLSKTESFHNRIRAVGEEIEKIIKKYKPQVVAVEKTFFSKNRKTALAVSEARGVVLYIAAKNKVKIFEYSPQEIKLAVTGYGKSTKDQVASMVRSLVSVDKEIDRDDEYDAIAIALTHIATKN